jgi:hypothetical protein
MYVVPSAVVLSHWEHVAAQRTGALKYTATAASTFHSTLSSLVSLDII